MQQMRFVNSYALQKTVFSLLMNLSSDMSGARSSAARRVSGAYMIAVNTDLEIWPTPPLIFTRG